MIMIFLLVTSFFFLFIHSESESSGPNSRLKDQRNRTESSPPDLQSPDESRTIKLVQWRNSSVQIQFLPETQVHLDYNGPKGPVLDQRGANMPSLYGH
ncbi:uncharacterized protein V6R79_002494 [Siganus canaliculatus]